MFFFSLENYISRKFDLQVIGFEVAKIPKNSEFARYSELTSGSTDWWNLKLLVECLLLCFFLLLDNVKSLTNYKSFKIYVHSPQKKARNSLLPIDFFSPYFSILWSSLIFIRTNQNKKKFNWPKNALPSHYNLWTA